MKDPYQVLGVAKTATADQIKQAYRKLARQLHPDVNPGDKRAEERFKEASAAYDFLSDAAKRAQYDAGEIDPTGAPKRRAWRSGGGTGGGRAGAGGFDFGADAEDILAEMMRRKEKGRGHWSSGFGFGQGGAKAEKGADSRHSVTVTFTEAALGVTRRVTLISGKAIDVRIPPATTDGQTLRLKGQGHPGSPAGDAYVDISVEPHPYFTRRDRDILVEVPVSLPEAVLGGKITVPTLDGKVSVTVPPGSNSGTVLRLKGKGIPTPAARGDQLVTLKVVLPEKDDELQRFVEKWGPRNGYDPRAKAGMG